MFYPRKKIPPYVRFWKYVDKTTFCWFWTGGRFENGYGMFLLRQGITVKAHRYSWELHNEAIPENLFVLHKCDTPRCVNPDHLFLGTPKENVDDAISKGRRLSIGKEKIQYILDNLQVATKELAEALDVSSTTINVIKRQQKCGGKE